MKNIIFFIVFISFYTGTYGLYNFGELTEEEKKVFNFGINFCKNVSESDYPTIFVPGIAASWYSEYGFDSNKVKRWIPDPISHVYDTLFYTFKKNGYRIADVFYKNEFTVDIEGNPKKALYLFGYDWKKDNKITATILTQLVGKILQKYEEENGCNIGKVNIIAHSMGGLVARSMLEDGCLTFDLKSNGTFELESYKVDEDGRISKFKDKDLSCNNVNPSNQIRIHKFITIGTPHRGAPKSFPTWEKGDISFADGLGFELGIWTQLLGKSDKDLYKKIHGYDATFPNGIVGLGQLLPDVSKNAPYNDKLLYLKKGDVTMPRNAHPKNSFLEDLNTTENIKKIFQKVDVYISYYSKITGNNGTNNIYQIELGDTPVYSSIFSKSLNRPDFYLTDKTEKYTGKDIYDYYKNSYESIGIFPVYNTIGAIRNESGLGGDGTVPSQNLLLVPNDSQTGEEIKDKKFRSREVKCYQENWEQEIGKQSNKNISINPSYLGIGNAKTQAFQVCQHIYMTTATSQKVIADILGNSQPTHKEENLSLWKHNGYTNYFSKNSLKAYQYGFGILNQETLDQFFEDYNYEKQIVLEDNGETYLPLDYTQKAKVFRYDILSPINVLITDEQGRKIGIDPETGRIINEIPGAWTSGDTEGSNEPEFFLIPQTGTGKTQHTLQTFGTGDGEYHIEMRQIDEDQKPKKVFTIQGAAKQGFEQDYMVQEKKKGGKVSLNYASASDFPAKIETVSDAVITKNETFTLRYFLKGRGENISKIQTQVLTPSGKKEKTIHTINGKIEFSLKEIGAYKVTLSLLDAQGNILKHIGAKKVVSLQKEDAQNAIGKDEYMYFDIPTDGIPFGIYVPKKSQ